MTITCDAIKIAYRQSKDGFVVSFAIHPQDMDQQLANAAIGSQWQLQLVELDENGNAESEVMPPERNKSRQPDLAGEAPGPSTLAATSTDTDVQASASASRRGGPAPDKERRPFTSLPLPQQAALLCNDPVFWAFMNEEWGYIPEARDADTAAELLRMKCNVRSRAEFATDKRAAATFVQQYEQFQAWRLVGA